MSDPISTSNACRTPVPNYDAMMSEATGMALQPGVTVNRTPEAPHHDPTGAVATGGVGLSLDTVGEAAITAGGGFLTAAAGSALAMYEQVASGVHTLQDGEKAGVLHDHNVLRGALAYFEGRAGSPEVQNRAQREPAFAEGLRRAEAFLMNTNNSARVAEFARTIRSASDAGIGAVTSGRDRGAEFECRMASDAVFRDGVTYARALRASEPAEFARRQALDHAVSDARRGQLRP